MVIPRLRSMTLVKPRPPVLLLDHDKLQGNVKRMASFIASLGVALRPHIKTHKCREVAEMQNSGRGKRIHRGHHSRG